MKHIKEYHQFITEGKGQELADKYVAKLRSEFRKLNDDELDEFKKTITQSLNLNEKGKGTWGKADADIAKEVRDEGKAGKLPIKNPSEFTKKERES